VTGDKKLVKFTVKANPSGQYYFPKEVRKELGSNLELICSVNAAVIFPQGLHPETVLRSLEVIQNDLLHRSELQKKEVDETG
jgi:bifunctional DNA-binding transcriptional regulator/antitoxin component of YhaV-PrlF toxin-antitoxin module